MHAVNKDLDEFVWLIDIYFFLFFCSIYMEYILCECDVLRESSFGATRGFSKRCQKIRCPTNKKSAKMDNQLAPNFTVGIEQMPMN